jgi:hypothetical protein
METCEELVNGKYEKEIEAINVSRYTRSPKIRCIHCHGAIRIHKPWIADSIKDHFEHLNTSDTIDCCEGYQHNPRHNHKMSKFPVE